MGLRQSSAFTPRPSPSYFTAFYSDRGNKRIVVITARRDGLKASTTPPQAVATSSGFWTPWRPLAGVELDTATVPAALLAELKRRGFVCSARDGNLRLALHCYKHEDDIEKIARTLREM